MKKQIFIFLAILAISPLFQSCNAEKVQSEVTIESITGTAEIRGNVNYNGGSRPVGIDLNIKPGEFHVNAAEQIVVARIPYASYVSLTTPPIGNIVLRDTTDVGGNFSFIIPVGVKKLTGITLEVIPFYAPHERLNVTGTLPHLVHTVYTDHNAFYDKSIVATSPDIMEFQILKVDIRPNTN